MSADGVVPPYSPTERWDELVARMEKADQHYGWVLCRVDKPSRRGGRVELVRRALERRGLDVEVVSRRGEDGSWLTWARLR